MIKHHHPSRVALIVIAVVTLTAAVAFRLWGAPWTVPQAPSPRARYTLRATWDGRAIPDGRLQRPIGVAAAASGDIYVTDARLRVVRFSSAGAFLGQWGREGDARGEFRNPIGIAISRSGAVYVSDYEQDRIQKFTPAGEFLLEFGRSGSEAGALDAPAGLTVDAAGSVYIADFYNHRVQKFGEDGTVQRVIGHPGRLSPGALHYPTGVAITPRQELLVADAYNYRLQWFDLGGRPLRRIGHHLFWLWPRPAQSTAGFFVPTDAAAGPDGIVHVADSGNRRVVMLSPNGEYAAEWRIPDADPNVYSPEHLAVSADGSTIFATDLGGNRLLVLAVTPPS